MSDFSGWFDLNNMLHVRQGEYSENGPLFTAEYWLARLLNDGYLSDASKSAISLSILQICEDGWYNPQPDDLNDENCHYSHDNMTGLYALCKLADISVADLPVLKWNNRWWLHPRDIVFYTLMKMNGEKLWINIPLGLLYLLILLPASLHSCFQERWRTSGKMLWWTRWNILMLHKSKMISTLSRLSWYVCEKLLKIRHGDKPMTDVVSIYFKEEGHPVKEGIRRIYGS